MKTPCIFPIENNFINNNQKSLNNQKMIRIFTAEFHLMSKQMESMTLFVISGTPN